MKKFIYLFSLFAFLLFISASSSLGYAAFQVFDSDDSKFAKSHILEILSKETVLYYSDGQTQLGSLFGQDHRIYVTIDRVPKSLKDAIVSAEDESFYTNIGIDVKGIARAAVHNLFSRSRQGASTITQQTVKNLYGRKQTDLKTKFGEMIDAFKLERMYSKDQILEFYLNQFHVTGNGRGVGVAAKYYFNKDVENLTLVEAAFIAGSVKGPEKYNPFTKTTAAGQEKAKREAFIRKNYVLERMYNDSKINQKIYEAALKEQVPFNQGRFQFNELATNQLILKQLSKPEILSAIGATGVDEIGTMGLRISTTLDKNIQAAAQYGLRQNLSRMQTILSGFSKEAASTFVPIQKPELYSFYTGKIDSVDKTENKEQMKISFGIPFCTIDTDAINRLATIADQVSHAGLQKSKKNILAMLSPGEYVLASVKKINSDGQILCDLENRPKVQGAALVLDKGKIVAMAGGFSSNEYNRAIFAQRQPGSTFKVPTYYAALQLGWSVLDPLSNIRDVFVWQKQVYFPRPDHTPTTLETTILGAGAKSENLASIWLLAHLLDKLNYNQFEDLLKFLGILNEDATKQQTMSLIVNKFNARANDESAIKRGILEKIKNDLSGDLNVIGDSRLRIFLRTLHYGDNFQNYDAPLAIDKTLAKNEVELRNNILKNNLIRWNGIAQKARIALAELQRAERAETKISLNKEILSHFSKSSDGNFLIFNSPSPWQAHITSDLVKPVVSIFLNSDSLISTVKKDPSLLSPNKILLDGVVPLSLVATLNQMLNEKYAEVAAQSDLEKLFWNADFRYSLGMYYAASMANKMGVTEPLQWVPSFPLGANSITLANLSLLYQTFLTGKTYRYFNSSTQGNQLTVIKRIEDTNGNLLWELKAKENQFADDFYSTPILNTLRGTITSGTGYPLNWSVILRSNDENIDKQLQASKIRVPIFGKTGTTNNYVNGTFIGFLPYPTDYGSTLSAENAYTIASYIGYDSNKPMVNKWYRVYGGAAIPPWEEIALNIIKNQAYAEKLNWKNFSSDEKHLIPFDYGTGLTRATVPIHSGVSTSAQNADNAADEDDPYGDDYSNTKQTLLDVTLAGSISNDIFIPKRKVEFFSTNSSSNNETRTTNSNNQAQTQGRPETKATETQPVKNSSERSSQNDTSAAEPEPRTQAPSQEPSEDLPPPPDFNSSER